MSIAPHFSRRALHLLFPLLAMLAPAALSAQSAPLARYGTGTPGLGGVAPSLWATDLLRVGAPTFSYAIRDGRPAGAAVIAVSPAAAALTFSNLAINVGLATAITLPPLLLDASGRAAQPLPLPPNPGLVGLQLYAQAFGIDPQSVSPLGLSASAGLRTTASAAPMLVVPARLPSAAGCFAVDLAGAQVATFAARATEWYYHAAFTADGSRAFLAARTSQVIDVFDTTVSPPAFLRTLTLNQASPGAGVQPAVLRLTPDGRRLFVVVVGQGQPAYYTEVFDAVPSSPTFGAYLGRFVQGTNNGADLRFRQDGLRAYFLALLTTGGPPVYSEIDTDPRSPTYLTVTRSLVPELTGSTPAAPLQARLAYAAAIAPAGDVGYLAVRLIGGGSQIALVDLASMTQIDVVPSTPAMDNIAMHPAGTAACLDTDLLGNLYVADTNSMSVIDVDRQSPAFGTVRTTTSGLTACDSARYVVANPAGNRAWFAVRPDFCAGSAFVVELDTESWTLVRTIPLGGDRVDYLTLR